MYYYKLVHCISQLCFCKFPMLTEDNYDQAVSILEKRFGNKQVIIHRHMDILLSPMFKV